ncbi:hypothetical protein MFIFM68171_06588 [Madurella fahalii]|uniref:MYND-type domain-containing protein n=1 Tax=Madurella fahalii TaxID=1157608 RepID=A0ABQ0GF39_9PEZI
MNYHLLQVTKPSEEQGDDFWLRATLLRNKTERFDWEANGLDRARFEALTKLLRLRYHGQVGAPTHFDESHLDAPDDGDFALDDVDSAEVSTLVNFGTGRLQRAFLDRLAELVANEKGGRHVSATLMTNSHDGVRVFVARNSKFRPRNEAFLRCIEALFRRIAEDEDTSSPDDLWTLIFKHYEARIHDYICDLRQILKRYKHGEQQKSRSRFAGHLRELYDAVFAQYASNAERNGALVVQAHQLYKSFSEVDFSELWPPGSRSLRISLGFLGRVRTSFCVIVRAAERLLGMANISISTVDCPTPCKTSTSEHGQSWTLSRLFKHLGYAFTDDGVSDLLAVGEKRPRWAKHKLAQEFDKLKSSTWEVHAEMQLLQLYIQPPTTGRAGTSAVDYIGCSKKSCFLCWHFLAIFNGVKTRGPTTDRIKSSVRDLESLMRAEIMNRDAVVLPQAKESTLGASTMSTVLPGSYIPSATSMISRYVENERLSLLVKASSAEEAPYDDETVAEPFITEAVATSGRCGAFDCEKATTRRCSHCNGAWFCIVSCEDEAADQHLFACSHRPITTADLLRRDCLYGSHPEDPQAVLEEKIIELFSALPENCRGGYYTWFLRHRAIPRSQGLSGPGGSGEAYRTLTSWAKQYCFVFLALLLDSKHPPPIMRDLDHWFEFGYVACSNAYEENSLSDLY